LRAALRSGRGGGGSGGRRLRRGSAGGGGEERRRSAVRKWWCGEGGEECRQWRTAKARSWSGRRRAREEWCRRWSRRRSDVRGCQPSGVVTAEENDWEASPAATVDGIRARARDSLASVGFEHPPLWERR
jgi:hypothetical protein